MLYAPADSPATGQRGLQGTCPQVDAQAGVPAVALQVNAPLHALHAAGHSTGGTAATSNRLLDSESAGTRLKAGGRGPVKKLYDKSLRRKFVGQRCKLVRPGGLAYSVCSDLGQVEGTVPLKKLPRNTLHAAGSRGERVRCS